MGNVNLHLTIDDAAGDLENIHLLGKQEAVQRLSNYMQKMACGAGQGDLEIESGTALAKASGTFTFASVIATDVLTINGVDFTCVASGATGDQFNVGGSDTATATNAAAAINASSSVLVSEHVSASSAAAVVTITAKEFGDEGDAITIASGDATITASGARLTGGEDATVTAHAFG